MAPNVADQPSLVRADWEALADRMIRASLERSDGAGAVDYSPEGVTASADDLLEGFARTFLLAALRIASSDEAASDYLPHYVGAISAAVREARWPQLTDHTQPTVEASAIASALFLAPAVWEALPADVQDGVLAWFAQEEGNWCADNNHVLLGALLAAFRAWARGIAMPAEVPSALDRIDEWYVGDGWYTDGEGRRFDHYNAWTFHLYPLLILRMVPGALPEREAIYRERLALFVDGYQHLFGQDGTPVFQGRSLIYRWGVVAPFWLAEQEDVSPLRPGQTRRLCSRVLASFLDRGAASDGTLSLGWGADAVPGMVQSYSGHGSPYWAAKGFLGLVLPADHPVWTDPEEPLACEQGAVTRVLPGPRWLVDARDGITRVMNFGSDGHPRNDDPLYRRLSFSSVTAPVLRGGVRDDDVTIPGAFHRGLTAGEVRADGGATRRALDVGGRHVVLEYTSLLLADGSELRAARLSGITGMPLRVSGIAVAGDTVVSEVRGAAVTVSARGLCSSVSLLHVSRERGAGEATAWVREGEMRPTPFGEVAAFGVIDVAASGGNDALLVWHVALSRGAIDVPEVTDVADTEGALHAVVGGTSVVLPWPGADIWPGDAVAQLAFRV